VDVGPRPVQVGQDVGVDAARLFQGVGQDRPPGAAGPIAPLPDVATAHYRLASARCPA
jgi:hypothetical protein